MIRLFTLLLGALVLLTGASNCSQSGRVKTDPMMSALLAGDSTAIVQGCGHQPASGYTYCRKREGEVLPTDGIIFHVPPARCLDDPAIPGEEPCVQIRIFRRSQEPIVLTVPRGMTTNRIAWRNLLDANVFKKDQRGFYPFDYRIRWINEDGREGLTYVDGEVRLVVYAQDYEPLHESEDSPYFVWRWVSGETDFRMTTGGRASVR